MELFLVFRKLQTLAFPDTGKFMLANPFKYRTCTVSWRGHESKLRSYRRDHITRAFKRGHFYEEDFLQVIADGYAGEGVFVDVGAFVGNHSVFFAKHCRPSHVIAFEPFPETFSLLRHNVLINQLSGKVACLNKAVSDAPGTLSMSVVSKKNRGMNRLDEQGSTSVEVTTLDRELSHLESPITFLKIDAEGHGSNVIRGAKTLIERDKPVIAVEVDPEPLDRISDLLAELGYDARSCHNATPTWIFQHKSSAARKAA